MAKNEQARVFGSSGAPSVVGDGATILGYSDRYAFTLVDISPSGRTITLQRDKATLLNGVSSGEPDALHFTPGGFVGHVSGRQRYLYERDPQGQVTKATLRKDGRWRQSRTDAPVILGVRDEHYDFNF